MTDLRTPTYLLLDPQHGYAAPLMAAMKRLHGLRPVCVYAQRKFEMYNRENFPLLRSDAVLEHIYLEDWQPADLAASLLRTYDVRAAIPLAETTVLLAAQLSRHFPALQNNAEVLPRFRDKAALKQYIRETAPHIPMNHARLVRNVDDVFSQALPKRYILKPNAGYGSAAIGFFDGGSPRVDVQAYFAKHGLADYVLEDFLEGVEYAINGQVDDAGEIHVVSMLRYEHRQLNGKPNVYWRSHHVRQNTAHFATIGAYVQEVVQAAGLRRSPFHAEVILTSAGPRLVEVGARFGGGDFMFAANRCHGFAIDVFEMAAHHYVSAAPYAGRYADWTYYNTVAFLSLDGATDKNEPVYRVHGVADVEALSEFAGWVANPALAKRLSATRDLFGATYSVQLFARGNDERVVNAADQVEAMIRFNDQVSLTDRIGAVLSHELDIAKKRGKWLVYQLLRPRLDG